MKDVIGLEPSDRRSSEQGIVRSLRMVYRYRERTKGQENEATDNDALFWKQTPLPSVIGITIDDRDGVCADTDFSSTTSSR